MGEAVKDAVRGPQSQIISPAWEKLCPIYNGMCLLFLQVKHAIDSGIGFVALNSSVSHIHSALPDEVAAVYEC
jgi:hypothetical protein